MESAPDVGDDLGVGEPRPQKGHLSLQVVPLPGAGHARAGDGDGFAVAVQVRVDIMAPLAAGGDVVFDLPGLGPPAQRGGRHTEASLGFATRDMGHG